MTEVIRHYDRGFVQRASLSSEVHALHLTETDVRDLVAFMQTLTSKDPAIEVPALPTEAMN